MKIHRFGLLLLSGAALIAVASAPLAGALPRQGTGIVPQYSKESTQEPALVLDTPEAIITRVGDRVRDRHAREEQFHAYAHFLPLYWEKRTVGIEIVDRVAKGGKGITYNITSLAPLNQPNRPSRIFPFSTSRTTCTRPLFGATSAATLVSSMASSSPCPTSGGAIRTE